MFVADGETGSKVGVDVEDDGWQTIHGELISALNIRCRWVRNRQQKVDVDVEDEWWQTTRGVHTCAQVIAVSSLTRFEGQHIHEKNKDPLLKRCFCGSHLWKLDSLSVWLNTHDIFRFYGNSIPIRYRVINRVEVGRTSTTPIQMAIRGLDYFLSFFFQANRPITFLQGIGIPMQLAIASRNGPYTLLPWPPFQDGNKKSSIKENWYALPR